MDTWAMLEVLMCRWQDIERLTDPPGGPSIHLMTRTANTPLTQEPPRPPRRRRQGRAERPGDERLF